MRAEHIHADRPIAPAKDFTDRLDQEWQLSSLASDELLRQPPQGHWGLTGMRERARRIGGQISFSSQAAAGTTVELKIPAKLAYAMR